MMIDHAIGSPTMKPNRVSRSRGYDKERSVTRAHSQFPPRSRQKGRRGALLLIFGLGFGLLLLHWLLLHSRVHGQTRMLLRSQTCRLVRKGRPGARHIQQGYFRSVAVGISCQSSAVLRPAEAFLWRHVAPQSVTKCQAGAALLEQPSAPSLGDGGTGVS
jgi:hypothetical protein